MNSLAHKSQEWRRLIAAVLLATLAIGCGGPGYLDIPDPIPDDRRDIPPPKKQKINIMADGFDKQVARQFERAFDFSRQFRKLAGKPKEALNVDGFDEVADNSWFTNRNHRRAMTVEELTRGPDKGNGPDVSGPWTVVAAKAEGVTPGFTIEDASGQRYVIKFDPPGYPEMATGAEIVSTKLFYAAGFNVPENYLVHFKRQNLRLGENVILKDKSGKKRPMTQQDLDEICGRIEVSEDGSFRALASKFLSGKVLGPFRYHGVRKDDPNDFIPHEHHRELRGLRVIAAWLNHFDTKANNTLDMWVEADGRHFVRHYLIDFGSTLGSQGDEPMPAWTGHEYSVDSYSILLNTLGLGVRMPDYEINRPIKYASVGRFDAVAFSPQSYKFIIPNPAFVNLTHRDGFWGAKIVVSFTDEQIRAAVDAGQYSDAEAAEYLYDVIRERRDIVGRYWFGKVNSLDRFEVAPGANGAQELRFVDLAVEAGLADAATKRHEYRLFRNGDALGEPREVQVGEAIPLPPAEGGVLDVRLRDRKGDSGDWSDWVSVYLRADPNPGEYSLLGLKRRD